jgi:hypothetical protein
MLKLKASRKLTFFTQPLITELFLRGLLFPTLMDRIDQFESRSHLEFIAS